MRLLWVALLSVLVLGPVAAVWAIDDAAPRRAPAAPTHGFDNELVVVTAAGLHVSPDRGGQWASPRRVPLGSFYTVVADAARPGMALTTNGDVYSTTDGGYDWTMLPLPPRSLLGAPGVTTLAADPGGRVLYAGAATVLAYDLSRHRWQVWGQGWPVGSRPTVLMTLPDHGLYAATGEYLYYAANSTARWRRSDVSAWRGAPITALALGPDGVTPYAAVLGHGVWTLGQTPQHLDDADLPPSARINGMLSDALGSDLYAATDQGLYVRHLLEAGTVNQTIAWRQEFGAANGPVVALRPLNGGNGMLALSRDGAIYRGARRGGQSLRWQRDPHDSLRGAGVVIGALAGAEWQGIAPPPLLPPAFQSGCLRLGPSRDQAFDVCGPFARFYFQYGQNGVLGYPIERAVLWGRDGVTQLFANVQMEWTPGRGVFLAPLGTQAAGSQVFPHPTPQQITNAATAYLNGYYVDPLFYSLWSAYLNPPGTGLSIFGPPLSQVVWATSTDGSGRRVRVQYFTNARLEYHPELQVGNRIVLSRLGAQKGS